MPLVGNSSSNRARQIAGVVFIFAVVAQVFVAWRFWGLTWDDSAITLGFARTFAQTGRIAPTPGSEIVEGYSTTLWMLLMSLASKLATTPAALLATAKIATLLLNIANLFLLRRWFAQWLGPTTASLIAGAFGCSFMFYETINGMETPLLLFLVVAMLLVRHSDRLPARIVYLLLGIALLLVRFEAAWLLVPFFLLERTSRHRLASGSTWLFAFLVENAMRWRYFGTLIPNTIVAKRNLPYTHGTHQQQILQHISQLRVMAGVGWTFALIGLIYLFSRYKLLFNWPALHLLRAYWKSCWQLRFTVIFLAFCVILTLAIGPNWGPPLRSFYPGLPFFVALLLLPLAWPRLQGSGTPLTLAASVLLLLCVYKVSHQVSTMHAPDGPFYMADTTVDDIRHMSTVLATIQKATGQHNILYAGEDMGAVQLYSAGIRVLDLGLLCDPTLARQGYQAIGPYLFDQRHPDVIEVHGLWTSLVDPGKYPAFLRNYQPVIVDGTRLFLTRDLAARINPSHLVPGTFKDGRYPGETIKASRFSPADSALNRQFKTYLTLTGE